MPKLICVPGSRSARLRSFSAHFTRNQPLLNRGVLLRNYVNPNGTIVVGVTRTGSTADRFYCKVGATQASVALPSTIDLTQSIPAGLFRLTNAMAEYFQHVSVPVTGIPPTAPSASDPPNQWISIGAYDDNGNAANLLDDDTFQFVAVPSASTANVSGKGCLFLAYTDPAATLPAGLGLSLPTNRPTSLTAPIDASNLLVNVPKNGGVNQTWNNHSQPCGPSGQAGDPDPTPGALIATTLASDGMTPQTTPQQNILDGLLAGMWDFGAANRGQPPAGVELPIGVGLDDGTLSASLNVPTLPANLKPNNLLLGLHSDKWGGTTGGALNLALTWS